MLVSEADGHAGTRVSGNRELQELKEQLLHPLALVPKPKRWSQTAGIPHLKVAADLNSQVW